MKNFRVLLALVEKLEDPAQLGDFEDFVEPWQAGDPHEGRHT